MQKYLNRSHRRIMTPKGNFFFFEETAFFRLNQPLLPERDTNFAMRASCEIRHVELFKGMMQRGNGDGGMVERWNGGIS